MSAFVKAAILGHPVGHTKSPLIHNYWIKKYGLSGEYGALDVLPENLAATLKRLQDEEYRGLSLTLPHKETALEFCDEVDDIARNIGAVNTILFENGRTKGFNTDMFGFVENIREGVPDFDFRSGPAVVLGAGGAAAALLYGLMREGASEIRLLNRTREKAEVLAARFQGVKVFDWAQRHEILGDANLLVNATLLGMKGQPPLEMDLSGLNKNALVNDIVYAPLETDLLKAARARGNKTVTGIGMLLHQARPAFEKWFGVRPEVDDALKEMLLR